MHSGIAIGFGNSRYRRDRTRRVSPVILFHTGKRPKYEKVCNNKGLAEHPYISHTAKERIYG